MALQIITGDLSVNKKQAIIQRLLEIKNQDPQATIYYIVPEHLKFDMETYMLESFERIYNERQAAMIDIQVVSFTRLAWFMINTKNETSKIISSIGINMIVRQILQEKQDELLVYRGQVDKQGFSEKLVSLFEELFEGNIKSSDLSQLIKQSKLDSEIPDIENQRLKELCILYDAFVAKIDDFDLANYSVYDSLIHELDKREQLNHHYIVIDHHYYFNAQQMALVLKLIEKTRNVWITLPISHQNANSNNYQPLLETPRYTYRQLSNLVNYNGLQRLADWDLSRPLLAIQPQLLDFAFQFKQLQEIGDRNLKYNDENDKLALEIWQTDSIQTEIRQVSNQIHHLVSNEGYRYRDILIVGRDLDRYQDIIGPYFRANAIPVFMDNVTTMDKHPFVIIIESLLNLRQSSYQYEDLMGLLKSDLIIPNFLRVTNLSHEEILLEKDHQLNYFENILLANGYFSYRLTSDFQWHFEEEDKPYINVFGQDTEMTLKELAQLWRDWLKSTIIVEIQKWKKAKTGLQAVEWLYTIIEKIGIRQQMQEQRDLDIQVGKVEESRRDEQVWQSFIDLLDEFYLIYKEISINYDDFVELLLTGLYESSYHIIPATLDQVMFTSMESPQVQSYKIAFIIGADEQALPRKYEQQSLLEESYREALKDYILPHQYLMNMNQQYYSQELLLTYQLLLNASDKLYISYATSINNHTVRISPYIQQLINHYQLNVLEFNHQMTPQLYQPHSSSFGRYDFARTMLIQTMRFHYEEEVPVTDRVHSLIQTLQKFEAEKQEYRQISDLLYLAFRPTTLPSKIPAELALQLYGKQLNVSVSKIEKYFQDPFSHFLLYGLRLKERKLYSLDYAQTGDYFHDYLDSFSRLLIADGKSLNDLTDEEKLKLSREVREELRTNQRFNILNSHPRFIAVQNQMNQRLDAFIDFIGKQQANINIMPIQTEAIFGINPRSNQLQSFSYPLNSGGKLNLTGKIDRIDLIQDADDKYLQIIDYKSGNKKFNLTDLYYGLDLQVLTYLSVALANYGEYKPFGAFYQPLLHKYQVADASLLEYSQEEIDQYYLSQNRLNGFVAVDEGKIQRIDKSIERLNKSLVYPIALKKDGSYNAYSKFISEEDLALVMEYVHYKFQEAANQIQAGNIALKPFQDEQYTTSLQKDYRVISGFDATEHYNLYRQKNIQDKEVIYEIKKILGKEEGND